MRYLFYFGHPAQYLFLRETLKQLSASEQNQLTILIKTKDVLADLVESDGFSYINILPLQRGTSKLAVALSLINRILAIIPIVRQKKPNLLVGTDATIAIVGKLFGINRITIVEDDYEVITQLARITYPFTQTILCPDVCEVGPWSAKKVGYNGYMKLGYLHPSVFTPNPAILDKYQLRIPYILIRLSRLTAHHDYGIRGIHTDLVQQVITRIESHGMVVKISSEGAIDRQLRPYLLTIDPADMHHILAYASLLISDSQSMSVEAAMLGVASIRYSDFVGRISVLEELENRYQLTFGIKPGHEDQLLNKLNDLMAEPDLTKIFRQRRAVMLEEKINVTAFLVWFLREYPHSMETCRANPAYPRIFK